MKREVYMRLTYYLIVLAYFLFVVFMYKEVGFEATVVGLMACILLSVSRGNVVQIQVVDGEKDETS